MLPKYSEKPATNRPSKEYFCDCSRFCKGQQNKVSPSLPQESLLNTANAATPVMSIPEALDTDFDCGAVVGMPVEMMGAEAQPTDPDTQTVCC
ncbi:hypothetical protein L208DRAFT_1402819 [Tricholoma matsutake]|nr:hypothetical protein L208DRAFT_1402819 [Tricholoma matsutake 945]